MSSTQHRLGIAALAATGLLGAALTVPAAAAEVPATLYVNNARKSNCADGGQGSKTQPYCTIQAAVNVAGPGQTVEVAIGQYREQVTVNRSGEPGRPIVIRSARGGSDAALVGGNVSPTTHNFLLKNVHDVTVRDFITKYSAAEGVLVEESQRVVVDSLDMLFSSADHAPKAGVRITGTSSEVTVSRNRIGGSFGPGIVVDPGVTGAVLTTNALTSNHQGGIRVTGAPGTVVTSNSLAANKDRGIVLDGGSSGSTVKNNIVACSDQHYDGNPVDPVEITVSADSAPGTKADHNSLATCAGGTVYSWAGQKYATQAAFAAATGQGTADLIELPGFSRSWGNNSSVVPTELSGSTDSADQSAPGLLPTDLFGRQRADHPDAANSAGGYADRGAAEFQAFAVLSAWPDFRRGPGPLTVTVTAQAGKQWPGTATYTFDFGDGSAPLVTTEPKAVYTYPTKGTFPLTVSAAVPGAGASITDEPQQISVTEPGDLVPQLKVTPALGWDDEGALGYAFDLGASISPWRITDYDIDFGDGSTHGTWSGQTHTYNQPGSYTVTAKLKDQVGRTATVSQRLEVAYAASGFTAIPPTRLLDTRTVAVPWGRIPAGESRYFKVKGDATEAVVLNVTAVDPEQAGFLTVQPNGAPRPATSNVNFGARQNVSNLVTVPGGQGNEVLVHNSSGGQVDVVVDQVGYYQAGAGDRFGALAPSRALDTRAAGGALGPDGTASFQVRGVGGVPAGAKSVVLNLTVTEPSSGGFLTAYASGTERPGTSNLNFSAGQTLANQAIVPIGADGKVTVLNKGGNTHVVADVFGYYGAGGDSLFTPTVPTRLVDTRNGPGAIGPGAFLKVASGAPAGATGSVLNVTAVTPSSGGYLTVWADGAPRPGTSNLNFLAGQVVPNHVTTPLSAAGAFDIYNPAGQTHVVADQFGYFTK
ncbi:parallel beta-helix repeat protein [Kitasatospora gansuensis]|uniref:Parallel beta-helix repeat protein n=1 Tax=Kitasatospora gansuensis TaxID=258050 RepID=A0A7W7SE55_9ACTN|nr:right-handed parallel beta-helix repeat-containing protein [Kitasatospora gansuensis]MBB4948835.1 parallel beta-helix repeat protein [Kitasatospora gansuensis]